MYPCTICILHFTSSAARNEHSYISHHHCTACRRTFLGVNQVEQHLKSKVHMAPSYPCPGRCDASFITPSALIKHLEQLVCPSGCKRADVDRFVHDTGRLGIETLLNHQGGLAMRKVCHSHSAPQQRKKYVCPNCPRKFGPFSALIEHVESGWCGASDTLTSVAAILVAWKAIMTGVRNKRCSNAV
jgi:hypothetical protein